MRLALMASTVVVVVGATVALANEPPPERSEDRWSRAISAAAKDLAGCHALAGPSYGDVALAYSMKTHAWSSSSSKSLGGNGERIAACVKDAIERHFHPEADDQSMFRTDLTHTETIGTPQIVLPAIDKLLPVWRRARSDAKARGELAKLIPLDYQMTNDGCMRSTRASMVQAEYLWLPTTGSWVPRQWDKQLADALGGSIELAMWRPNEIITRSAKGLCVVDFGADAQAALRSEMDKAGACWVGGFEDVLLHPRTAFPADVAFTQVATQSGRACALSTAGEVTCCGRPGATPPMGPFTQLTVGEAFECALDRTGAPTCWGTIEPPAKGPFTKLSAEYSHVCGVRKNGTLACWGSGTYDVATPPAGTFSDVAAAQFSSCGVHKNGKAECWGEPHRKKHPVGMFTRIAADWTHACGLRKDGSVGCWGAEDDGVDSPLAGPFTDIAVGDAFQACGRRRDGTLACTAARKGITSPPTGTFTQLAGDHDMFCAVGTDHHIACWGHAWPNAWNGDNTWPYASAVARPPMAPPDGVVKLAGRIVDEHGAPLANVDILACRDVGPCSTLASQLVTSPSTLGQLAANAKLDPALAVLVTTGADGRWAATMHQDASHARDLIPVLITAPGRELLDQSAVDPTQPPTDIALRPASKLDIDLRCGKTACPSPLRLSLSKYTWVEGTHLEHIAPGSYAVVAITAFGQPGERRGVANVDVTFAGGAKHVRVAALPVGGGSIKGSASGGGSPSAGVIIRSRCEGTASSPVYRDTKADANGNFELRDVGIAPCTVSISSARSFGEVKVPKVPATNVRIAVHPHEIEP
ncbi:MAG TPA: hypothetical protein VGM39_17865 [Kofleriaceae bacterium]|jgi:hypothetical protein